MEPDRQKKDSDAENARVTVKSLRDRLDQIELPEDRESILSRLGYSSYDSYLDSPLWGNIRGRVLKRDQKLCLRCGDRATEVHHSNYREPVLRGDDDAALVSLCRMCHETVERDPDGRWRPEAEKHEILHDEGARRDREARQMLFAQEEAKDRQHGEQTNGQCDWCGGAARSQGSMGGVLRIPRGDALRGDDVQRVFMCVGCYETIAVDGRGRRRAAEEQRALLSGPASRAYARPDVRAYGHANQPQNWKRMNVRQRESWEAERNYRAALLKDPTLAESDPASYEMLKKAFDQAEPHGRAKRRPRFRPARGPDPIPGPFRNSDSLT